MFERTRRVYRRSCRESLRVALARTRGFVMQIAAEHGRAEHGPVVARVGQMQVPHLIDGVARHHVAAGGCREEAVAPVFVDRRACVVARPSLFADEFGQEIHAVIGAFERMHPNALPQRGVCGRHRAARCGVTGYRLMRIDLLGLLLIGRGAALSPGVVVDEPRRAVLAQIQLLHFVEMERTRADAAEDGDLVAGFVDGAIAFETFRQRQRRVLGRIPGDHLRFGSGEKP